MTVQDWLGADNTLGIDIWERKYRNNGESFEEWLDRVSGGDEKVKDLIINKKFLFGGRILANRNVTGNKTYSNCYVLQPPEDNLESIFDTAKKLARTFSYGGGVGIDLGNLAPKGAKVNNTAKESSGAVSFMDLYNTTTGLIGQNGRRGALMLSMPVNHPDIREFIKVKSDLTKITNANISVRVTDDFMKAVENDDEYELWFDRPESGEKFREKVNARELFKLLCEQNWNYAEPGMLFWDNIESHCLLEDDFNFQYAGTNPCLTGDTLVQTTHGEIPIKDLVGQTPDVYCMGDDGELTVRTASKVWMTRKDAQIVEVVTKRGSIRCTPDHRIHTRNRGWVCACDLKHGDKITGLNRCMKDEKHLAVALTGGRYMAEHRFVACYYHDIAGMDVHHIDGDTFNNSIDNLEVLSHSDHSRLTNTGRHIKSKRDTLGRYVKKEIKKARESINQGCGVGTNWVVSEVKWLEQHEDVYDMTVPDVHNFVANRMVVHNCAEEPLPAGGSCLLGSINLSAFVREPFTDLAWFDIDEFKKTVNTAVKALNDVLDEGLPLHPLEEQRNTVRDWRQIGLGIMGLADCLIKLGLTYGSSDANQWCGCVAKEFFKTAVKTSEYLGVKYGNYPEFREYLVNHCDMLMHCGIRVKALRNSQLLTIAPTGTLSTMLGISGGIEPIFANSYTRKTQSLHGHDEYYTVYTPIVKEYMDKFGITNVNNLPKQFVTSAEIAPIDRINCQAAWQEWIDASISSTINLPNSATVEDVANIYYDAWVNGLKGVTVYRAGCAREGVLVETPKEEPKTTTPEKATKPTPKKHETKNSNTIGLERHLTTGCGTLHVCAFFDEDANLVNTYLSKGSTGGCNNFMIGLSRMISLAARTGASVESIVDQLHSCGVCPSYAVRTATKKDTSKGSCCPVAVGNALKDMQNEVKSLLSARNTAKTSGSESDSSEGGMITPPEHENSKTPTKSDVSEHSSNDYPDNCLVVEVPRTAPKCPRCGEPIVQEGGCVICKSCGWSKCD